MIDLRLFCPLCGSPDKPLLFHVPEMMFGTKELFEYGECQSCKGLRLLDAPSNMSKYYPADYYSFKNATRLHYPWWMLALKRARAKHEITGHGYLGKFISKFQGKWPYFQWFRKAGVSLNSSILDVGCGHGDYLRRFSTDGFTKLTGIDPYIESDVTLQGGIVIYKQDLEKMTGQFDCIFSKDSFEHMVDPKAALRAIFNLTCPGGVALIAIPVAESGAWHEYGTNWFQVDAPRHMTIPSKKSIQILAATSGFVVQDIMFDSTVDQFLISDAYRRGISLQQLQARGVDSVFSSAELARFQEKAQIANSTGRGDHACFILRKPA